MMTSNLQRKISENSQRRAAENWVNSLTLEMSSAFNLEKSNYQEFVRQTHGLKIYPSYKENGIDEPKGYSVYSYLDTDSLKGLSRLVYGFKSHFKNVYLRESRESLYFEVSGNFVELFLEYYCNKIESSYHSLDIFQSDFKKGLTVCNYVGYLPDERRTNNDELVYECIYWEKI